MKKIPGGVTAAKGFLAAGVEAGIKYTNRLDMALVYSEVPAISAGTFTTNVVKAAPVKWDQYLIETEEKAQAIVLNSGIANACTKEQGKTANEEMAKAVAEAVGIPAKYVLTASTGVIGVQLPVDKVQGGSKKLGKVLKSTLDAGHEAAKAIMTTDTISKECAVEFELNGVTVTVGGMSKGSGMIHPNMATMLGVVTTDVAITKELLMEAVRKDVKDTFNMISVDRDTSTNDSLMVLANGLAGNEVICEHGEAFDAFCNALHIVNETLAKMMAKDGEGATKLFEVTVQNATTKEQAVAISKSVITSNLVKTMIYGNDANWGRIFCAMGYSGVEFDPEVIDLSIESKEGTLSLVENGIDTGYSEEIATKILSCDEVTAYIDMKAGDASATAWGCDLTYDYVKINGDYRS